MRSIVRAVIATALLGWAMPAFGQVFLGSGTLTCTHVNTDTGKRIKFTYRDTAAIEALLDLSPGSGQFLQFTYQPTSVHHLEIVNRCNGGVVQEVTDSDTCTENGAMPKQSQSCTHHFDATLTSVQAGELLCDLSESFGDGKAPDILTLRGKCAGALNVFGFPCLLSVSIGTKDAFNIKGCN